MEVICGLACPIAKMTQRKRPRWVTALGSGKRYITPALTMKTTVWSSDGSTRGLDEKGGSRSTYGTARLGAAVMTINTGMTCRGNWTKIVRPHRLATTRFSSLTQFAFLQHTISSGMRAIIRRRGLDPGRGP